LIGVSKAMFGTTETTRKDRIRERKFIEKCVSLVWLLCKCGKKVSLWWAPRSETFRPTQRRKLGHGFQNCTITILPLFE